MDIKTIKTLINLFESSFLGEMEVESGDGNDKLRVTLKKSSGAAPTVQEVTTVQNVAAPAPEPLKAETGSGEGVLDYNLVEEIKSPMVGVFYAAPSPDAEPFVTRGSKVKKGDTLCIIEAMKLMNEVIAERDGEIVEVLAESGELVEFGQTLFRIF